MSDTVATRAVYIVESDESVRQGLARVVDAAGLEPTTFESLDAFLRGTPERRSGCVVLDTSGLRGCPAAVWSKLRAMAAAVPVIALSARDGAEARRLARELGAAAFFRKPVDAAALLDAIDWVTSAEGGGPPG